MPSKYEQYVVLVSSYEKHPDQGLKTCKKKLQRDPNNVIFLLAQAHFLQKLGREQDAVASCEAIKATAKDPLLSSMIVHLQDIIATCQHSLSTFSHVAGPALSTLWKDAMDGSPKQFVPEVQSDMLRAAMNNEYWDLAQQLFARLQKEHPKTARYHFAWVALSELQAEKMLHADKTGQSLRMLAYRSLKAAVENTLSKKDVPRKISTAKDLRLLVQIYRQQNYDDDLLAVLDNPEIGIDSDVGKNDVEFVRIKIDILSKQKRWDELKDLCFSSLRNLCVFRQDTRTAVDETPGNIAWADDWNIWKTMMDSSSHSPQREEVQELLVLAKKFLNITPKSRNAGRASLLYLSYHDRQSLLENCKGFFDTHRTNRSCFEDLRQFLEDLNTEEREAFHDHVSRSRESSTECDATQPPLISRVISEVNALKLEYLLCVSKSELKNTKQRKRFISDCLNVYKLSAQDIDESGDEACILAVIALMKLDREDNEPNARHHQLIQAAFLLESLRDDSQDNYKATLLSLCISQLLGLGSLALSALQDLSLREIQYDTLSHLLYTRISTLHPFAMKARPSLEDRHKDPLEGVIFALKWKPRAVNAYVNFMAKDLENVHFDKFQEFSLFKERLEKSLTRAILQIEKRRIARLTDVAVSTALEEPLAHFKNATSDNRDYYSIPNFECKDCETFDELVLTGEKPGMYWLATWTRNDILQTMMTWKHPASTTQLQILSDSITYATEHKHLITKELTSAETDICQGWEILQPLIIYLSVSPTTPNASKDPIKDLTSLLQYLTATSLAQLQLQPSATEADILPYYTTLQSTYLQLELLKAILAFTTIAQSLTKQKTHPGYGKFPADVLLKIQKSVREIGESIRQQTKLKVKKMEGDGIDGILEVFSCDDRDGDGGSASDDGSKGEMVKAMQEVIGKDRMRKFAGDFLKSGVEALNGVLKVKI